jgi:rhomboid protease GluP
MKIFSSSIPYATYILVALNVALFMAEIQSGGSQDFTALDSLGALIPAKVWAGEWWRLLNANFLHFGLLHLGTNMFALFFLGRLVELYLGVGKYLLIYLVSGMGSMFTCALVYQQSGESNVTLMGASAAIMGLIGTLLAIALQIWLKYKNPLNAKRLRAVIFVIVLQFILDNLIPQISFYSHLFGLIIGFLVSATLLLSKVSFE